MRPRLAIGLLLSCAVLGDAVVGVLRPAVAGPPLLSLAAVAGVALFAGARIGMVSGFAAGVVLDLLSGTASVAGMHTLTMVLSAAAAGYGRRHPRHGTSAVAAATGGLAVGGAVVLSIALQRLLGPAVALAVGAVLAQALAVGGIVTPIACRTLQWRVVRPLLRP